MGLYRKHRSAIERRTEVSPIGYQALTPATSEPVERIFSRSEFIFMQPHCELAWATSYMY